MDFFARLEMFSWEDLSFLQNIERRQRIFNVRENDFYDLDNFDFRKRYRFDKSTIEAVVEEVEADVQSRTDRNSAISPLMKVLTAIRFFAFGNQQLNIGDIMKISQPSTCTIINEVAHALAKLRPKYIYLPCSEVERQEISRKFYTEFGFPSVLGALDCTLIKITSPGGQRAETFRCRKGFFALNVQTLADSDLFIRNIVVRWPGSTHDTTVFDHSYLRAHLETEVPHHYHVLGDNGYPLRQYLMTPFLKPVGANQIRYNLAQCKARNVVERQYGVWKRRFGCLSIPLRCQLQNAQAIIVATAVLHNLAMTLGDEVEEQDASPEDDYLINMSQQVAGVAKRNSIVADYFS